MRRSVIHCYIKEHFCYFLLLIIHFHHKQLSFSDMQIIQIYVGCSYIVLENGEEKMQIRNKQKMDGYSSV
jgi:hypothetical protein